MRFLDQSLGLGTGLKPGVNENVELRQLSDFWGKATARFTFNTPWSNTRKIAWT